MHAVYTQLARQLTIAPAASVTVTFYCGHPYRDYTAWLSYGAAAPNLSVQPKFGGYNDGAAVPVNSPGVKKVFQVSANEVRPSTDRLVKHPADAAPPAPLTSELVITNNDGAPATVTVYMIGLI